MSPSEIRRVAAPRSHPANPSSAWGSSPPRRLLLAIYGTQRRPRVQSWSREAHVRAWARRWWIVEAADAEGARRLIASCGHANGRILDCGRGAADVGAALQRGRT